MRRARITRAGEGGAAGPRGCVTWSVAEGVLELLLGHRGAALDAALLRLLVEVVLGALGRAAAATGLLAAALRGGLALGGTAARGFALPDWARSLFTVREAISFARPSDMPRFSPDSLMCSY